MELFKEKKKKNAFKWPGENSNLINFYNGLPKGVNSSFCQKACDHSWRLEAL